MTSPVQPLLCLTGKSNVNRMPPSGVLIYKKIVICLYHWSVWYLPNRPTIKFLLATLMHTFLYFRKQIWTQARHSIHEQPDIHSRLMSRYRQGGSIYRLFYGD